MSDSSLIGMADCSPTGSGLQECVSCITMNERKKLTDDCLYDRVFSFHWFIGDVSDC